MTLGLGDDTGVEAVAPLTIGATFVTVVAVEEAVDVDGIGEVVAAVVVVGVAVIVAGKPLDCLRKILDNI